MFQSYQAFIEGRTEQVLNHFDVEGYRTSGVGNMYRLFVQDGTETLLVLDFDFQNSRVHVLFDGASSGPRSAQVFWWTPGVSADDAEVNRYLTTLHKRLSALRGA